jgi:diacylglycerol kinase family enzyme
VTVRRIALIVNPFASRVTDERLAAVVAELSRAGEVAVRTTHARLHATELAAEASATADAVVVFSGDGGFNEALNGLTGDVPIGFVPGGGASVLSRALGFPTDPVASAARIADALAAGRTRRIAVGRVNGRRFAFSAGIGLDAAAVRKVDDMGRRQDGRRPGDLAFALAVLRVLAEGAGRLEPALEIKGLGRAACAFVANGRPYTYAKGLPLAIAPDATFELGLDLVAPIRIRRRSLLGTAWSVLRGRPREGVIYAHDVDRIEIACDRPMAMHADGEDLGDVTAAVFEAERDAATVLI